MQDWTVDAIKKVFLICDMPGHGRDINDGSGDDYPDGNPEGLTIQDLMPQFNERGIELFVMKLKNTCNKMIEVMKANHPKVEVQNNWEKDEDFKKLGPGE